MSPLPEEKVEALAEALGHARHEDAPTPLLRYAADRDHAARIIAPLVAGWLAEAEMAALLSAAREARERGDIGKDDGPEAWVWLEALGRRAGHPQDRCDLFRTPMGRCTCGGDA